MAPDTRQHGCDRQGVHGEKVARMEARAYFRRLACRPHRAANPQDFD
jgi:hypothetical protein